MITKQKNRETVSTDEQRRAPENVRILGSANTVGNMMLTVGIIEIVYGIIALFEATFSAVAFVWLLSGTVLISGTLGMITTIGRGMGRANWPLFAAAVVSVVAGLIGLGHPLYGFNFFGLLMGLYLAAVGIAHIFSNEQPSWARAAGVIAILFGIWIFFSLPAVSSVLISILVGIVILAQGVIKSKIGIDHRAA